MKKIFLLTALLLAGLTALVGARPAAGEEQVTKEKEAVRQAVLDYVEGIYQVDPARVERSVHADLAKRGYYVKKGEAAYSSSPMTFTQLIDVAKNFNKEGRVPKDAPKEVVIYEVLDQTASAKLTAFWGVDYMHLAKYDGRWMIVNVLWQQHPKDGK